MRYFNNIEMWLALVVVTLAACTEEVNLVKDIQPQTMTMKLNGGVIPFDADNATRAEEWNWKEGDVVYIMLYDSIDTKKCSPATATYQKSGLWNVSISNPEGVSVRGKCNACYIDNESNNTSVEINNSYIRIKPEYVDGIYSTFTFTEIKIGDYVLEDNFLTVNVLMRPLTSRVHLKNYNDPKRIDFTIKGEYFTSTLAMGSVNNDGKNAAFVQSSKAITITGVIPEYIYLDNKGIMTIINNADGDSLKFTRTFGEDAFKIGHSGTLTIPTKDNYESLGWTWENKPVDIEAVDLGLPSGIKWANMNVGATKPEEFGYYFAWGETEPKTEYSWNTYKYGKSDTSIAKYCISSEWGTADNKTILDAVDDAAWVNWKDKDKMWRMPTINEISELIDNCEWKDTVKNGINGYNVVGSNGNSIFLPAAGWYESELYTNNYNNGVYWSSSLNKNKSWRANIIDFNDYSVMPIAGTRKNGFTVRPVLGPILFVYPDTIYFSSTDTEKTVNVRANVAWKIESKPNWLTASSELGEEDITITLKAIKDNPLTEPRDGEVVFVTTDGSNLSAKVNVTQEGKPEQTDSPVAVDLGLPSGTKWANMNLGAEKPEDVGLYFAWGETTAHTGNDGYSFDWNNYKWCKGGDYNNMTKYYHDTWGDGGWVPSETLQSDDDAATQWDKWNGSWRMPTEQEIEELLDKNNTSSKWETINGVEGLKITSKKYSDIFIFLPAAGYIEGTKKIVGENYYWSATINSVSFFEVFDQYAWSIMFNANNKKTDQKDRCLGFPIRPVQSK